MVSRSLLNTYGSATRAQIRDGISWYPLARAWIERACRRYHVPRRTVTAVVAVLSQRTTWAINLQWADRALRGDMPPHIRTVRNKVARLLAGEEPARVLSGPKITEFYRALMGDTDAVVLDTWMLGAIGHHRQSATPRQYARLADAVVRDAALIGAPPSVYQAIVWCVIRSKSF